MKTTLGSRRDHYLVTVCIFLITAALIAAMIGCVLTQYDLTISSTEGGEVTTPREDMFTYDEGTIVELVAEADDGYRFVKWTGNVSAIADVNADVTTITMHDSYSIIANFEELDPGTLFAGGNGTEENPYQIANWHHLYNIRDYLNSHFILINDLDSSTLGYDELASPTANQGKGWEPIGTEADSFIGSLDGQGYEVRDLFINRLGEYYVGLFGIFDEGAQVEDITLVNATVTGYWYVGGLVGVNVGAVRDSYSSSSVTGFRCVGRLIGYSGGTVSNSYSTGSVTGNEYVGGLIGDNQGTVSNSYSSGNVTGGRWDGIWGNWVGGLTGFNGGTVSNSYSNANVTGSGRVGGLVGENWLGGTLSDCYSTGSVTGIVDVGGLVGLNAAEGSVSNSFWDTQTSGQATSDDGTGKTTTQMKSIATFSGADWDIIAVANPSERNTAHIWNIVDDETYPFLSWQPV